MHIDNSYGSDIGNNMFHHVIDENYKVPNSDDYTLTSATYSEEPIKLDPFHYHEVIDRLYILNCNIQDFLLDHPVVEKHKK